MIVSRPPRPQGNAVIHGACVAKRKRDCFAEREPLGFPHPGGSNMAKAKKKTAARAAKKTTTKTAKKTADTATKKATKSATVKKAAKKTGKTTARKASPKTPMAAAKKTISQAKGKSATKPAPAKAKPTAPATKNILSPKKSSTATPKTYRGPKIGEQVADFSVPSTAGHFKLSEHKGEKILLYFYPKDATPGCTVEGHDFSNLAPQFAKFGVSVYGISRDSVESHYKFIDKEGYKLELLSDPDETACKLFDVIQLKNMYGKDVMGIERSTFLIDGEGRLLKEWRKVSVDGHALAVLESVKNL